MTFDIVTETTGSAPVAPFRVTQPNIGSVNWEPGDTETVLWTVGNSDQAPINCSTVNIDLSTDGGFTYPTNLATAVPNDGSHDITVPVVNTAAARVRVACASLPDHFFFDISDADFAVQPDPATCITDTIVRNLADSGNCTLRASVAFAETNGPGLTVTFAPELANSTITLASEITIAGSLTIDGEDKNITVSGGDSTRVFRVNSGTVVFDSLTIAVGILAVITELACLLPAVLT